MKSLDVTACLRAPVRIYDNEEGFQIGKLLRVDVDQPDEIRAFEWQQSDNVPAVWLVEVDGLCWLENASKGGKKKLRPNDESGLAAELFHEWHDRKPIQRYKLSASGSIGQWYRVGAVKRIDYASDKWTGKHEEYTHEVSRGTSLYLAELSHGQRLWLCKGRLKVTPRGLVN